MDQQPEETGFYQKKKKKEGTNRETYVIFWKMYYLKKCAPTIRSWDLVFSPIKFKSIVEVLLASMQWGGQYFSRSAKICCFNETFSMTACSMAQFSNPELAKIKIKTRKIKNLKECAWINHYEFEYFGTIDCYSIQSVCETMWKLEITLGGLLFSCSNFSSQLNNGNWCW